METHYTNKQLLKMKIDSEKELTKELKNKKILLKINMEPFNGMKWDTLEVELSKISDIKNVYKELKKIATKEIAIETNLDDWAKNSLGNPIRSIDGVRLTKRDVHKTAKAGIKPWEMTKDEIDKLVIIDQEEKNTQTKINEELLDNIPWEKDL